MPRYMRLRIFVVFCVVLYLAATAALLFVAPWGTVPGTILAVVGIGYLVCEFFDSFWHWVQTGHVCVFVCHR